MKTVKTIQKEYLGDSVYVEFDGFHIVLTTSNDEDESNVIYLDPNVSVELVKFIERLVEYPS